MARGSVGLVIVSAIVLAGVVFMAPRAADRFLPAGASDILSNVGSAVSLGSGTAQAAASPADLLDDSPEGLVATGPIAAHSGNQPVFIADVITGHQTKASDSIPAEITTIRPILGCMPTPPTAGAAVGHATSGPSGLGLALSTYDDADLAEGVQAFVDGYRADGAASVTLRGPAYESYDVAVTETRAPVYLVLENTIGNRMWNLHLAPGVQIERVVLLGGDQAGVANLDPVVPVEVILNDGLAACGIQPAYEPNPGNLLFQPSQTGALSRDQAEMKLAATRENAAAYDIWFRDSFGVLAGESRVGFDKGMVSVIGPLPEAVGQKAPYAAIAGARIRTTQDQYFEISGQVAEGQDFAARVTALATDFASGDLANLRQGVDF